MDMINTFGLGGEKWFLIALIMIGNDQRLSHLVPGDNISMLIKLAK